MPQQPTPEQIAAFQEKLKSMTPEQIRELQKQQCIFCKIIDGSVPSKQVYDDEFCIAILDINPGSPGHLLLMPKEHVDIFPQLSDETRNHLAVVSKRLSLAILKSLNQSKQIDGTSIVIANGQAAGQRATHLMIHIIPRKKDDGLGLSLSVKDIPEAVEQRTKNKLVPLLNRQQAASALPTFVDIPPKESAPTVSRSDLDKISSILGGVSLQPSQSSPIDTSLEGSSIEFEKMEKGKKKSKRKRAPKDLIDTLGGGR